MTIEKGVVTITVSGDQHYYIGEQIQFSGTSSAGKEIFLMIKGPNINTDERKLDQFSIISKNDDPNTFVKIDVKKDFTWSYLWDTSKIGILIDNGIYTVYAIEKPRESNNLSGVAYSTVSIILNKKPVITVQINQSQYIQGEFVTIKGYTDYLTRSYKFGYLVH